MIDHSRWLEQPIVELDVEECRLKQILKDYPFLLEATEPFLESTVETIRSCRTDQFREMTENLGHVLISTVIEEASGKSGIVDDRTLYWTRLLIKVVIREVLLNESNFSPRDINELLDIFEIASRRHQNSYARQHPLEPKVVITGFDPFKLNDNLPQSNPSAVIALDTVRKWNNLPVVVYLFPVRYQDFDDKVVEKYLANEFMSLPRVVATLSMGREQFDLERFPGIRRSSIAVDNLDYCPVTESHQPRCMDEYQEFLEFTLPTKPMIKVGGPWSIQDNRTVETQQSGKIEASELRQLQGEIAVRGSGGGFLSNEIAYRTRFLQLQMNKQFPLGHIHVPRIQLFDTEELNQMSEQTRRMLWAVLDNPQAAL